jgi:FtsH-binding integral membrane protein
MTQDSRRSSWLRPILFGLLTQVLAILGAILVVTAYATFLAFQVRGTPDQKLINHFAASSSPWVVVLIGIVLALFFSFQLSKKAPQQATELGIVLGLSSAVFATVVTVAFHSHLGLRSALVGLLLLLASWLGAILGLSRVKVQRPA